MAKQAAEAERAISTDSHLRFSGRLPLGCAGFGTWLNRLVLHAPARFGQHLQPSSRLGEGGILPDLSRCEYSVQRRYLPETLILETTFTTAEGEARLIDCFPMHPGGREKPYQQILRFVEGVAGRVDFAVEVAPRFDYGEILPWIVRKGDSFAAFGGSNGLFISGEIPLDVKDSHNLSGGFTVVAGQRRPSQHHVPPARGA